MLLKCKKLFDTDFVENRGRYFYCTLLPEKGLYVKIKCSQNLRHRCRKEAVMTAKIIIGATEDETRMGLVEDGFLMEYLVLLVVILVLIKIHN